MTSQRPAGDARDTELSIQEALRRWMLQAPLPFAVTRGAEHTLVYANSAFRRLADIPNGDALGAPLPAVFHASARVALGELLDRAFRDGVDFLDERIAAPDERGSGWRCSVWPVIGER